MARRKTRTRYVRRAAKRVYSRSKGGNMKPFVNGAIAGVAAEAAQKYIGRWGAPVAMGAVGWYFKDNTLKTISGLQIGSMVGDMIPMISGGGSALGGGAY